MLKLTPIIEMETFAVRGEVAYNRREQLAESGGFNDTGHVCLSW